MNRDERMKLYDVILGVMRGYLAVSILQRTAEVLVTIPTTLIVSLPAAVSNNQAAHELVGEVVSKMLVLGAWLGPLFAIAIDLVIFAVSPRVARFIASRFPGPTEVAVATH
jgi:ABC-type dipeptide/oligopeptide/nickel transport system permease subunit